MVSLLYIAYCCSKFLELEAIRNNMFQTMQALLYSEYYSV